ncbi:uncharacterized protein LOC110723498 [Chenopodium quinoa]|uniref:uncharacterized protein LOC110723498 n=1 Tax=Chenopodium quinoa TaxID=63459 RepID=UPI000B772EEE|nr:uncharacterized protein LOC110723498 [Chenopodium quinoa]
MNYKLVILATFMVILVALTHTATPRTTKIDIEDGVAIPGKGNKYDVIRECRHYLSTSWPDHCEQFVSQSGVTRYWDNVNVKNVVGIQEERPFDTCCSELRVMMDPVCQCEAMKMMVEKFKIGPGEKLDKAMELPLRCGTMETKCTM